MRLWHEYVIRSNAFTHPCPPSREVWELNQYLTQKLWCDYVSILLSRCWFIHIIIPFRMRRPWAKWSKFSLCQFEIWFLIKIFSFICATGLGMNDTSSTSPHGIYHGTCELHVGIANPRWRIKPCLPGAWATRNLTYLARGPRMYFVCAKSVSP